MDGNYVVFDLGGGTFEVSILEVSNGYFKVRSVNGDTFLGHVDFDDTIVGYLVMKFLSTHNIDFSQGEEALDKLQEASVRANVKLCSSLHAKVDLPFISLTHGVKHLNIKITRSSFEREAIPLFNRIMKLTETCLKNSQIEVDQVILVGQMIHYLKLIVSQIFEKTSIKGFNRKDIVAIRAALRGSLLCVDSQLSFDNVTPLGWKP